MSHSVSVTIEAGIAAQSNELGLIICKSCNEVIATQPTDGYKSFMWCAKHAHAKKTIRRQPNDDAETGGPLSGGRRLNDSSSWWKGG